MGLFKKKQKEIKQGQQPHLTELPKLPELPKMPGVGQPKLPKIPQQKEIPQPKNNLPRFPNNPLGAKFAQNTIKHAVTGQKEGIDEDFNHYEDNENQTISEAIRTPRSMEYNEHPMYSKKEPVFIRLDKFEEAMKVFEDAKGKIIEIEGMLKNIKKRKEEEESELVNMEKAIQAIKSQIEKVDNEVFSKV